MSKMEEVGLKLVAHFNRHGDIAGQQLFYQYTVEVEKELKEKRVLTIERNPLPGNSKSILDKKSRNEKMFRVVELHHFSEANARWAAKRALTMLRAMEPQERFEYSRDMTFLHTLAEGYKIKGDHVQLFVEMVQKGVNDASVTG